MRGRDGLYLELIYHEDTSEILYASQYYITQKMNKSIGKEFKKERKERSYSDDENMILNTIKKN
jgi:flavorubredoxin